MKKWYRYITSIFTLVVIIGFGVVSTIKKDNEISMLEGRTLQQVPTKEEFDKQDNNEDKYFFAKKILNGDYFKTWDNYFSDQIFGRGTMVNEYADVQKLLNKTYINEIIFGDNGYVFTVPNNAEDEKSIEYRVNYYSELKDEFKESSIYFATYPSKDVVYSKYVPIKDYKSIEEDAIQKLISRIDTSKVTPLNLYYEMQGKEDLFYKTDHHWNMNGVYLGYETLIKSMAKEFPQVGEPKSKDSYNIETYSKVFVGSNGRRVGQLIKDQEDIQLYRYPDEDKFKVTINGEAAHLYYPELIDEYKYNNDYDAYIRGDNAETIIENTRSKNDLKIVMIGDSMDNPLVPLMAENFNKVYSFDLRYYKQDLNSRLHEINPDIILVNSLF